MADPVLSAFRDLELDPRDESRARALGAAIDAVAGKGIDTMPGEEASALRSVLREFVKSARMRWDDALVVRVIDEWLLRESDAVVRLQLLSDRALVTEVASLDEARVLEAWQAVATMAKKAGDANALARAEIVLDERRVRKASWSKRAETLRNTAASSTGVDQARALAAAAEEVLRFGKPTGRKKSQGLVEANAEGELERAFDLAPADEDVARLLANAFDARRRLADRTRVLKRHAAALEEPSMQHMANVRVAYAIAREGSHADAVRVLRASNVFEAADPWVLDRLVASSVLVDDFEGATEALEAFVVCALPPSLVAEGLAELVSLLAVKRGRLDLAELAAERLRAVAPTHAALSLVGGASSGERTEPIAAGPEMGAPAPVSESAPQPVPTSDVPRPSEVSSSSPSASSAGPTPASLDGRELETLRAKLRKDPTDSDARLRLKSHYRSHGPAAALVELVRYELGNASSVVERRHALEELCGVHRALARNDAALIGTLSQLVALDPLDADAARELADLLEKHGRWRDALVVLGKLADSEVDAGRKLEATRHLARRWSSQMPQAPQAAEAWEKVITLEPSDAEAFAALREIFIKRHAHAPLAALLEGRASLETDASVRHSMLLDAAKLAAERLARPEVAIAQLRRVLAENPSHLPALEALERIADARRDYTLLAEVMEGRLALVHDDGLKLAALQRLAALYAERLNDPVRSLATWRRVLEVSPSHARAARAVRDALVMTGDFDELERTYEATGDWDGFVAVLVNSAEKEADPARKYDLIDRAAHVLAAKHPTGEAVVRLLERLLALDPKKLEPARKLVAMHEGERRFGRLGALYESLLEAAADADERTLWLGKLVELHAERIPDAARAWRFAADRFELTEPSLTSIDALDVVARRFSKWADFTDALQRARARSSGAAEVTLRARIATVQANELGSVDDAVATLNALWADGHDVFRELEGLLRAHGRRDELRAAYTRRLERLDASAAIALLGQLALLEEEVFGDVARAMDVHRAIVTRDPSNVPSLRALVRFAESSGDDAGAASGLKSLMSLCAPDERSGLRMRRARILERDESQALEAWSEVEAALQEGADDHVVVPCLEALAKHATSRATVLPVLADALERLERWMDLVGILGALGEIVATRGDRHAIILRRAEVYATRLSDRVSAAALASDLVAEAPSLEGAWDALRRYGADTGSLDGAYATAIRNVLEGPSASVLPASLRSRLASELALLLEAAGDDEDAMRFWILVVDAEPTNEDARTHGLAFCKQPGCDLAVIERFFRAAFGDSPDADALGKWGAALVAQSAWSEAADRFSQRLELLRPTGVGFDEIEHCLENAGAWARLEQVIAHHAEVEGASADERVRLRLRRVAVLSERIGDKGRALDEALSLLSDHPANPEVETVVERLANEFPARAVEAWRALAQSADLDGNDGNLGARLVMIAQSTNDAAEKEAALRRARTLGSVRNSRERFDAVLAQLVRLVPGEDDVRTEWLELLRSEGRTSAFVDAFEGAYEALRSPETRRALAHAATVAADLLDDAPRACAAFERLRDDLEADDEARIDASSRALELRRRSASAREVESALARHLLLPIGDVAQADALRELARLGDANGVSQEEAYARWSQLAAMDANADDARARLVSLAEALGRWSDAAAHLAHRASHCVDAEQSVRFAMQHATILVERLNDARGALATVRAIPSGSSHAAEVEWLRAECAERAGDELELRDALVALVALEVDTQVRSQLRVRLARQLLHMGHAAQEALGLAEAALDDDGANRDATQLLQSLLDRSETRSKAASLLLARYGETADEPALLVAVLEASAATADDDAAASTFLLRAALVAEEQLRDSARALALGGAAFERAPYASVIDALAEFVRVARACGQPAAIFDAVDRRIATAGDDVRAATVRYALGLADAMPIDPRRLLVWDDVLVQVEGPSRAQMDVRLAHARATGSAELMLDALERREAFLDRDDERFASERERLGALDSIDGRAEDAIQCLFRALALTLDADLLADLRGRLESERRGVDALHLEELVRSSAGLSTPDRVRSLLLSARTAFEFNGDAPGAVSWLEEATTVDATDERIPEAVRSMLAASDVGRDEIDLLAQLLERSARARADADGLVAALELRRKVAAEDDRVLLEALADAKRARGDAEASLAELWVAIVRMEPSHPGALAGLQRLDDEGAKRHAADALAAWLRTQTFDDDATASLCEWVAFAFIQAGERASAAEFLLRAYRANPTARDVHFATLDELLAAHGDLATRVELHRERTHGALDVAARFERLLSLADLEEQLDGNPERARGTYEEALDVGEFDLAAVAALERVYTALHDWRALFDLLVRRLERCASSQEKTRVRTRIASVALEHLDAPEDIVDMLADWLREGNADRSSRQAALDLLVRLVGDERVRSRIVDECAANLSVADGGPRARVLEVAAELAPTKGDAAHSWIELARHELERPTNDALGRRALLRAFAGEPSSSELRGLIAAFASSRNDWAALAHSLEATVQEFEPWERRDAVLALVTILDEDAGDPRRALAVLDAATADAEADDALHVKAEEISMILADWRAHVRALRRRADASLEPELRTSCLRRAVAVAFEELSDAALALSVLEVLLTDADAEEDLAKAVALARATGNRVALRTYLPRLLDARAWSGESLEQDALELAELVSLDGGDVSATLDVVQRALDAGAPRARLGKVLLNALRTGERFDELARELETAAERSFDASESALHHDERSQIFESHLRDDDSALRAAIVACETLPTEARFARVAALGKKDPQLLEEALRFFDTSGVPESDASRWDVYACALRVFEGDARTAAARRLGERAWEAHRGALAADAWLIVLEAAPEDDPFAAVLDERLIRFGAGFLERYADALGRIARDALDPSVAAHAALKQAVVLLERLGRAAAAVAPLRQADDAGVDQERTLELLVLALEASGDSEELATCYARSLDALRGSARGERAAKLARLRAALGHDASSILDAADEALASAPELAPSMEPLLEAALGSADTFDRAQAALETIYRVRGDRQARIALRTRAVAMASDPSARVDALVALARCIDDLDGPVEDALAATLEVAFIDAFHDEGFALFGDVLKRKPDALACAQRLLARMLEEGADRVGLARFAFALASSEARGVEAHRVDLLRAACAAQPDELEWVMRLEESLRAAPATGELVRVLVQRASLEASADARMQCLRRALDVARDSLHDLSLAEDVLAAWADAGEDDAYFEERILLAEAKGDVSEALAWSARAAEETFDAAEQEQRWRAHARRALAAARWSDALRAYEQLLSIDPANRELQERQREAFVAAGDFEGLARALDDHAIAQDSDTLRAELLMELALVCSERLSDDARAKDVLRRALETGQRVDEVLARCEPLAARTNDDAWFVEMLETAADGACAENATSRAVQLLSRAASLLEARLSDPTSALERLERARSLDDRDEALARELVRLARALSRWELAIEVLEANVEREPSRLSLTDLVVTAEASGEGWLVDRALDAWRRFAIDAPELEDRLYDGLVREGRIDDAISFLVERTDRMRGAGRIADARESVARALDRAAGERPLALLELAVRLDAENGDLLLEYATRLMDDGRSDDARDALEAGLGFLPRQDIVLRVQLLLASIARGHYDLDRARKHLTEARKLAPTSAFAIRETALVAQESGDHAAALAALQELLILPLDETTEVKRSEALVLLARAYEDQGETGKAKELYGHACAADPTNEDARRGVARA